MPKNKTSYIDYLSDYRKKNMKTFTLSLNTQYDDEIIKYLDKKKFSIYIKSLIREDMRGDL